MISWDIYFFIRNFAIIITSFFCLIQSIHTPHYQNVPFEVPSSWVWCKLEKLCYKFSTGPFGSMVHKSDYVENNGLPFINPTNIVNGKINLKKVSYISADKANELERYRLEEDDILLARRGDLSKCAIVTKDNLGAYCGTGSFVLHLDNMNPKFFSIIYASSYLQAILKSGCVGATMNNLNQGILGNILVPCPPLYEQYRIVIELEKWVALIDALETNATDLQTAIAKAQNKILDLAIHGKLVPQNSNDEPANELLKHINSKAEITCDNGHYQNLPDSWYVAPMQMLCSLTDGKKQSGIERINLDVKYLRGEHDAKMVTPGKYIAANFLLILVDGENSGEVFQTPIEGYQGSTFKQLSINSNMNANYILQVINLHRKTLRENKVGSAIPHLNKKLFRAIEVPIPPYNEQQRIVNAINVAFKHLDTIIRRYIAFEISSLYIDFKIFSSNPTSFSFFPKLFKFIFRKLNIIILRHLYIEFILFILCNAQSVAG
ncbi:restriction endonuclease subunit S [uncultured Parabacteroides sp.]|jgi:type I restriction enzyme S subunit|uniref:restriction endonuclease subunit S n=2 Tax=uncultured Parabacteroides sp. TaxID=512312 RepID=UPI00345C2967